MLRAFCKRPVINCLGAIRNLFITTERTPNPNAIKLLPGRDVLGHGKTCDFPDIRSAYKSPLAKRIFAVNGVSSCFLGPDFITIIRSDENEAWAVLNAELFAVITDFFNTNLPVINEDAVQNMDTVIYDDDDEVVAMIKELLDTRIRPTVIEDGGDITFISFDPETGLLQLSLVGACASCPSSIVTLKDGVENMMKFYVPEVTEVEQITTEEQKLAQDVFEKFDEKIEKNDKDDKEWYIEKYNFIDFKREFLIYKQDDYGVNRKRDLPDQTSLNQLNFSHIVILIVLTI